MESLQHAGHIITVNLTPRFSAINFYSLKYSLAAFPGASEIDFYCMRERAALAPANELARKRGGPNNKPRIIYALLSHVIERPIVCILHH